MPEIVTGGPCVTLRDVRRNRDRCTAQLGHQPVAFLVGKALSRAIRRFREVHRLLPDSEVAITPHWSSRRTDLGHCKTPKWGSRSSPLRRGTHHRFVAAGAFVLRKREGWGSGLGVRVCTP